MIRTMCNHIKVPKKLFVVPLEQTMSCFFGMAIFPSYKSHNNMLFVLVSRDFLGCVNCRCTSQREEDSFFLPCIHLNLCSTIDVKASSVLDTHQERSVVDVVGRNLRSGFPHLGKISFLLLYTLWGLDSDQL